MKWYFSIVFFLLLVGCKQNNERSEFIRLEKNLASVTALNDGYDFMNPYPFDYDYSKGRMAEYTDSLSAIGQAYDSLILKKENPDFINHERIIYHKIQRREGYKDKRFKILIDSLIKPNRNVDNTFSKYALRVRMSRIFHLLYTITYCGNGAYNVMDLHPFITYQKGNKVIKGEYGLGYIVDQEYHASLTLSKLGKKMPPTSYRTNYIETKGIYALKDTGIYQLKGYN